MSLKISAILVLVILSTNFANGKVLQILHTNDLHSFWEHGFDKSKGGYARLKAMMDSLEAEGDSKGWVTIRLDAGDFSEGSLDFFAGNGSYSYRLAKMLNYDVVALGNHEFVMGLNALAAHAKIPEERIPLVASNFESPVDINLKPGRIIYRSGLKIAVVGATTDEKEYRWGALPALITAPMAPVQHWLGEQNADINIALSHLGLDADINLVRESKFIDLVIGGHTHDALEEPVYGLDPDKNIVPIVQAGSHAEYLGRIVVELPQKGSLLLKSYELLPMSHELPEDQTIKDEVNRGKKELNALFLPLKLDHVIGEITQDYVIADPKLTPLACYVANTLREAVQADAALDLGELYGKGLAQGKVTVGDILNLQPHRYDFETKGWTIYTCKYTGSTLRSLVNLAFRKAENAILLSGIAHKNVIGLRIDGNRIVDSKIYKVAFSEGVVKAARHQFYVNKFFPNSCIDTKIVIKDVILQKIMSETDFNYRLDRCLQDRAL